MGGESGCVVGAAGADARDGRADGGEKSERGDGRGRGAGVGWGGVVVGGRHGGMIIVSVPEMEEAEGK